jgi:predicted permease
VCAAVFALFGLEKIVVITSVIEAACPAAASATMFAINYNKNAVYASEIFAITTILSVVSLPVVILLAELITGTI